MNTYFNQPMTNFGYAQQQAPIKWTNPLTKEEEAFLKQNSQDFTLECTKEELVRSVCTHKNPEKGVFTLVNNDDGTVTCTTCGATFNPVQLPKEEIEKVIGGTIDILQSIKLMYVDMNADSVRSYFQMIPFLEKASKLYQTASETMRRVAPNGPLQQTGFYGNPFANLTNALGTPGFGMPVYGQGMGMNMNQPYQQQPMYQNGFVGQQAAPYGAVDPANPFQSQSFGQVAQPPVGQVNNVPNTPVTPATAPAAPENTNNQQQVEVHKQFDL